MKQNTRIRNIKLLAATAVISAATVVACSKKLDTTNENGPSTASYFKTANELQNGVNAVYSSMRAGNLVGREWFFTHDMRGAETNAGGAQLEAPRAELMKQPSPSASNSVMTSVWNGCYQMINRANVVISKGPDITDNPSLRDQTVAEAKFLRAWAYFELVSMWNSVPVYTEPPTGPDDFKGLSSSSDIYSLIISDLTAAAAALPATPTPGRASSGAAWGLLGRVEMQKGDYGAAETALLNVYNKYSLVPYLYNFNGDVKLGSTPLATGNEYNAESLFEVSMVDKGDDNFNWGYTGEGPTADASTMRSQEYGIVWGNVIPSDIVLDEFEPNDPRYGYTFYESGDMIVTMGGTVPGTALTESGMNVAQSTHLGVAKKRVYRKGSVLDWTADGFHPDGLNQRILRYADVLLMLAECEAVNGSPAQAAAYINEVRARPGVNMPPVNPTTKNDAIKAVMHERTVELAGEELSNIDMLRYRAQGFYTAVGVPDPKPNQVDYFPIPASEISTNPMLK